MMREEARGEKAEIEIKSQRKGKQSLLGRAQTKRVGKRDKETEEESNHLKGLKVSVRLTHFPAAKMEAKVSSSCVCRDER